MADSNITKRALASSLKELMMEQPFEQINVAQICERCNMCCICAPRSWPTTAEKSP